MALTLKQNGYKNQIIMKKFFDFISSSGFIISKPTTAQVSVNLARNLFGASGVRLCRILLFAN
jgi:hypothetical protein